MTSPTSSIEKPLLNRNQPIEMHEPLFNRIIASIAAIPFTIMVSVIWYSHGQEFLQMFVSNEESREHVMSNMDEVMKALFLSNFSFLIKGIFCPANRGKGSGNRQLNCYLNVFLSIWTGVTMLIVTDAMFVDGFIGIFTKIIYTILALSFLMGLSRMHQLAEFIDYIWNSDVFNVNDIISINGVRYQVLDIHLNGIGGVVCKEEKTGLIVNMPSAFIQRARINNGRGEFIG